MKSPLLLCLFTLLLTPFTTKAEQAVTYPDEKPLIGLTFPDDWKLKLKDGTLVGHPANDSSLFVTLHPLDAGRAEPEAAVTEVKKSIEEDFKDVAYDEPQSTGADGVDLTLINAKGTDEDGRANLNFVIIDPKQGDHIYLLECVSSQSGFEKHSEAVTNVIRSLHAAGAESPEPAGDAAESTAAPATQTFAYPDKEHPDFAIDFPADWKLEPNDDGIYVESADRLVALNVLFIDHSDVDVAVDKIKEGVAAKYESAKWNEPTSNTDEKLGVTAHFHSGTAESKGRDYSLNVAQYVRKDGNKFMVLICQNPTAALEKDGDAIEKMLQSIKVR